MAKRISMLTAPIAYPLALLAIYAASYYAMVRPVTQKFHNWIGASLLVVAPQYPDSSEPRQGAAAWVFAPMHGLDRRLRPRTWQGPLPTTEEWNAFFHWTPHGTPSVSPPAVW